jgi:hypothetical protein
VNVAEESVTRERNIMVPGPSGQISCICYQLPTSRRPTAMMAATCHGQRCQNGMCSNTQHDVSYQLIERSYILNAVAVVTAISIVLPCCPEPALLDPTFADTNFTVPCVQRNLFCCTNHTCGNAHAKERGVDRGWC